MCVYAQVAILYWLSVLVQLAAQVLDDFDDEDIGFGLVDAKKSVAVAKKLGNVLLPDATKPQHNYTIIPLSTQSQWSFPLRVDIKV